MSEIKIFPVFFMADTIWLVEQNTHKFKGRETFMCKTSTVQS